MDAMKDLQKRLKASTGETWPMARIERLLQHVTRSNVVAVVGGAARIRKWLWVDPEMRR